MLSAACWLSSCLACCGPPKPKAEHGRIKSMDLNLSVELPHVKIKPKFSIYFNFLCFLTLLADRWLKKNPDKIKRGRMEPEMSQVTDVQDFRYVNFEVCVAFVQLVNEFVFRLPVSLKFNGKTGYLWQHGMWEAKLLQMA